MVLACASVPTWSQACTPTSPLNCGAAGGVGLRPTRSPNGGAGNGTGGDATVWITNTSEGTGNTATAGTGGTGANGIFNPDGSINVTATGGSGGGVGATDNVSSSVTGGAGGAGEAASTADPQSIVGAGGGGGGAGVFISQSSSTSILGSTTTVAGGAGGKGGDALATASNGNATNGDPGAGGGGGAGAVIGAGAGSVSLTNNGQLLGGVGGAGGNGGYAGGGGGGGDGLLVLGAGAAVVNNATGSIVGGRGGNAGTFQDSSNEPGGYGGGGAGVNLVGAGSSLQNAGTITGGNAGTVSPVPSAQDGTPGVGIRAWGGASITTSGVIAGGNSGTVQADSVLFSGGDNELVVISGATFTGNIESTSVAANGGDTLALGGDTNGSINTGLFLNFLNNIKTGNSTWTLTGLPNAGTNWTIEQGQLVGDTNSIQGSLTFSPSGVGTPPSVDFNQGSSGVFLNVISGAGQVLKDGAGTLTLVGANTYTGGTVINAGTLQGNATSLQGNMVDNGTLFFVQQTDGDFAGEISGTGRLQKVGAGTLSLSGANTYSGGTTVLQGILKGNTTSLQGDITLNDAAVDFDQPTDGDFTGSIGGIGQLIKDGAGTLTLKGVMGYNLGTVVNAGNLQGDTTTLRGAIFDNATVTFAQDNDAVFDGVITGSGQVVKTGNGMLTLSTINPYSGGTVISGGGLQGDSYSLQGAIADNAMLVFTQQRDGIFDGTISGTGQLVKNGSGTLVLNDANTFTGNTEVTTGKLVVGDDAHAGATLDGMVTVDSGAALGGIGSIGGLDLSGMLTPGNSIGTLNVNGNATFHPGSSYQFEVSPDGTGDHVAVTGHVSILGGSALALANDGNWAPQTQFPIITAGGGVTGQFDSVTSNLAFLTPSLSYSANAVRLQLARNDIPFDEVAQTRNQRSVAGAIDPLGMASPIYKAVVGLDASTARQGFDALSGEQFASTNSALIDDSRYVRDAINRHLLGQQDEGAQATDARGVTAWTSAWGHWGAIDGEGNAARMQANGSGLLVGADLGIGNDARLGAVAGHRQESMRVDDRDSNAHATTTDLGLYGDVTFGAFALRGGVAYAWQRIDGTREVAFGTFADRLGDRYDAHVAHGFIEGGYRFDVSAGQQIEPFLNLARVQLHTDSTRERGSPAALAVTGGSDSVNIGTLGLRDRWSLAAQGGMDAHVSIGWQQAWGDVTPTTSMRFASGSDSFDISGTPIGRHAGVADAGLSFALARNVSVDASYIGRFGDGAKDQGVHMGLAVRW
nr:autotransporter domain-containing protein [Pinirhizobacter soli]